MTPGKYEELAMRSQANQAEIGNRLANVDTKRHLQLTQLRNGVTGLSDEVGELNACVKKFVEYGQPLDIINIQEEVGDCLWRLVQICQAVGYSLEQAMIHNIEKLKVRYPNGYTDFQAAEVNRDRVAEKLILEKLTKEMHKPINKTSKYGPSIFDGMVSHQGISELTTDSSAMETINEAEEGEIQEIIFAAINLERKMYQQGNTIQELFRLRKSLEGIFGNDLPETYGQAEREIMEEMEGKEAVQYRADMMHWGSARANELRAERQLLEEPLNYTGNPNPVGPTIYHVGGGGSSQTVLSKCSNCGSIGIGPCKCSGVSQTGQGWAEPSDETLPNIPIIRNQTIDLSLSPRVEDGCVELIASFGDGLMRDKPLNHSYSRYCKQCGKVPIHEHNTASICPSCAADVRAGRVMNVQEELNRKVEELPIDVPVDGGYSGQTC